MFWRDAARIYSQPESPAIKAEGFVHFVNNLERIATPQVAQRFTANKLWFAKWSHLLLQRELLVNPEHFPLCPLLQLGRRGNLGCMYYKFTISIHSEPDCSASGTAPNLKVGDSPI